MNSHSFPTVLWSPGTSKRRLEIEEKKERHKTYFNSSIGGNRELNIYSCDLLSFFLFSIVLVFFLFICLLTCTFVLQIRTLNLETLLCHRLTCMLGSYAALIRISTEYIHTSNPPELGLLICFVLW